MAPAAAIITFLKTAAPKVAQVAGPELAKWLAKNQNRAQLAQRLQKLKSRKRKERLRARIQITMDVLESIKAEADDPARIQSAEQGLARARKLLIKLDLPLATRAEKKANVKSVESAAAQLLNELRDALGDDDAPSPTQ